MAIRESQIKDLTKKFEDLFEEGNGSEIGSRFSSDGEATAENIVDNALKSEAFPIDANMYNVKNTIYIKPGMSTREWAESYIDAKEIETNEEFQSALNDDLYYFVADNLDKTAIEVKIEDSLSEWLEKHGTVEYLEKKMEKAYEPIEFEEIIKFEADTSVQEKVNLAITEEGFPPNTTYEDVEYLITDVKLTETFESLAERHIDDVEPSGSVTNYINNRFYKDIIKDDVFTFEVEITSDPEDF